MLLLERYIELYGLKAEQKQLVADLQDIVNHKVLGSRSSAAHWHLAMKKNTDGGETIGEFTLPNDHCRKFIENFDLITDLCVPDNQLRRDSWNACVSTWVSLITLAQQKNDLTDSEIEELQDFCDDFFLQWLDLHGRDGITNYIHLIGSGHLIYYVCQWRNLYKYSQQG